MNIGIKATEFKINEGDLLIIRGKDTGTQNIYHLTIEKNAFNQDVVMGHNINSAQTPRQVEIIHMKKAHN